MTKRDPGRGQLHKRGARVWRDEENPTGPGQAPDEVEVGDGAELQAPATEDADLAATDKPVNAAPGGGGATESAGRAKEHEGVHGGPSRKR